MAMRSDTMTDLFRINSWLTGNGSRAILCYGQSVKALENSVALGLEKIDTAGLPKLERSEEFYKSILIEITEKERNKFNRLNNINP